MNKDCPVFVRQHLPEAPNFTYLTYFGVNTSDCEYNLVCTKLFWQRQNPPVKSDRDEMDKENISRASR